MSAPSFLRRNGTKLALGTATAGGIFWYYIAPRHNMFVTPGVRNIERAYTAGGGSATHQPAYGSVDRRRGNPEAVSTDLKGRGSIGDVQREQTHNNAISRGWNDMKYGHKDGK